MSPLVISASAVFCAENFCDVAVNASLGAETQSHKYNPYFTTKNRQVSKSSKDKLTFIGWSGFNHSAFYLYTATSVGFVSYPLLCTCACIREVWLVSVPCVVLLDLVSSCSRECCGFCGKILSWLASRNFRIFLTFEFHQARIHCIVKKGHSIFQLFYFLQ